MLLVLTYTYYVVLLFIVATYLITVCNALLSEEDLLAIATIVESSEKKMKILIESSEKKTIDQIKILRGDIRAGFRDSHNFGRDRAAVGNSISSTIMFRDCSGEATAHVVTYRGRVATLFSPHFDCKFIPDAEQIYTHPIYDVG